MSEFDYLQARVAALKPGERIRVDRDCLKWRSPIEAQLREPWTPAEWLLEGVAGATWTHEIHDDPRNNYIEFARFEPGDRPRYVSPDRRVA